MNRQFPPDTGFRTIYEGDGTPFNNTAEHAAQRFASLHPDSIASIVKNEVPLATFSPQSKNRLYITDRLDKLVVTAEGDATFFAQTKGYFDMLEDRYRRDQQHLKLYRQHRVRHNALLVGTAALILSMGVISSCYEVKNETPTVTRASVIGQ